jgi:hypothetical protein
MSQTDQLKDYRGNSLSRGDIVTAHKQLTAMHPTGGDCRIARRTPGIIEDFLDDGRALVGFEGKDGATIPLHAETNLLAVC